LCRLVLLDLLPAVIEHDLNTFGEALTELQERVGACFAPAQGGLFASTASAEIVAELSRLSLIGAGQSSWGPTLYAFGIVDEKKRRDLRGRLRARFGLPESAVFWTQAASQGALLEVRDTPLNETP
jgi:beta-ribofuranosylaminobenzene 5'-phosphate synthase